MELAERLQAGTAKSGSETVELSAEQWLRIQHGTLASPTTMLQVQVPAGKKWTANIFVDLLEQDA